MAGTEPEQSNQSPTNGRLAQTYADMMGIAMHPAFRVGFLDGQFGREFDHDEIMSRIVRETHPRALERISWQWTKNEIHPDLFGSPYAAKMAANRAKAVELAQYRYEEGRRLAKEFGLRCKAWGHPDYPPKAVTDFIVARAMEAAAAPSPSR